MEEQLDWAMETLKQPATIEALLKTHCANGCPRGAGCEVVAALKRRLQKIRNERSKSS